jgi:hypothetical protein
MPCPEQFDSLDEIDYPDIKKNNIRRKYINNIIDEEDDITNDRSTEYFMIKNNKILNKLLYIDMKKYYNIYKDTFNYKYYNNYLFDMKIKIINIIQNNYL